MFRLYSKGLLQPHKICNKTPSKSMYVLRTSTNPEPIEADPKPSVFKFSDYDCIGFDLDNTLTRFKYLPMLTLGYKAITKYLIEERGYNPSFLHPGIDSNFVARGLILDDENGNLVRVAADGTILRVGHGSRMLMKEEIFDYYPARHWRKTDAFIRDPLLTWHNHYFNSMYVMLDVFDLPTVLAFARAVDEIDATRGPQKNYNVWTDILEGYNNIFDVSNFEDDRYNYYSELLTNPHDYYHQPNEKLIDWLTKLKENGKTLFLVTSAYKKFAEHSAKICLGSNWKDLFDLVVFNARKPGFFTHQRPFWNANESKFLVSSKDGLEKTVCQGNFCALTSYLKTKIPNKLDLKFLYVGDHLVHDVYAPDVHTLCDTVFVCPELEDEGFLGFEKVGDNDENLFSFVWGSFFFDGNKMTNWCQMLKKHSQLCVPSIDYVATLPVGHEYAQKHLRIEGNKW